MPQQKDLAWLEDIEYLGPAPIYPTEEEQLQNFLQDLEDNLSRQEAGSYNYDC